jgi:hypothetical protein
MSMKTTIPALTGAMLVLLAAPALAGRSTPQEREATRQLNLEAAQQAKSTNQQIASANTNTNTQAAKAQSAPEASPTTPVESAPAAAPDANQGEPGANPPAPAPAQ